MPTCHGTVIWLLYGYLNISYGSAYCTALRDKLSSLIIAPVPAVAIMLAVSVPVPVIMHMSLHITDVGLVPDVGFTPMH